MKRIAGLLLILSLTLFVNGQWEPDAGLIQPYTHSANVIADGKNPGAVIDGNMESKWESANPLPENYISDKKQNLFLQLSGSIRSNLKEGIKGTDGSLESNLRVNKRITYTLPEAQDLSALSIKASGNQAIRIKIKNSQNRTLKESLYTPGEAYQVKRIAVPSRRVKSLEISSGEPFTLFEVAAMSGPPEAEIIIDLKRQQPVGWIDTRHYGGKSVNEIRLYVSANKKKWNKIGNLNPEALQMVTTRFNEREVRYIKLVYQLTFEDYAKAFLWKIRAYNRHGPYGPMPVFTEASKPLKNILGVNTFWGWGMQKHATDLPPGKGPEQFSSFIRHVRYYHNLDWDVADPDQTPDYSSMPGSLRQLWLDWDKEYKPVWNLGYSIQTTLQIPKSFSPSAWDTPTQSAYRFGEAFARHFGPQRNYLVQSAEIGNEPWKYGPEFYKKVFNGMSRGINEAAPRIMVMPCALSANKQQPHLNNYIGNWLEPSMSENIDALNTHLYSYANTDEGKTIAVNPEHPESRMRGILNLLTFRNKNIPGRGIQVTEWGWDSSSETTDCSHPECVSEEAQAAYAIRGLLMFYRLGIEKAFWYFHSDEDKPSHRFTRSGMLTSPQNGLKPKKSWYALRSLIRSVGNEFLYDVIEKDNVWIYYFKDASETPSHIVLWVPEKYNPDLEREVTFKSPRRINKAFRPGALKHNVNLSFNGNNLYSIHAGTYPIILELK